MNPVTFISTGRCFYGLGIAGIGLIHFFLPGLRPIMAPVPPEATWPPLGYLAGAVLTLAGIAIVAGRATRTVSLFVGVMLLLFFVFGHLPSRLRFHPESLGYWTDAIKLLALAGGSFVLSIAAAEHGLPGRFKGLGKLANCGRYLFALMLVLFGTDHFIYNDLVKSMVPAWIPAPVFWTYATGLALSGAGLAIVIKFNMPLVSLLLAVMLLMWLVMLHVPATLKHPFGNGNLAISSLQCLAFGGIALLISGHARSGVVNAHSETNTVRNAL